MDANCLKSISVAHSITVDTMKISLQELLKYVELKAADSLMFKPIIIITKLDFGAHAHDTKIIKLIGVFGKAINLQISRHPYITVSQQTNTPGI